MVRVHHSTIDKAAAWRVRDTLASHPLLGGAMAQITVCAGPGGIVLQGWIADDALTEVATRLATRAVGHRPIHIELQDGCYSGCTSGRRAGVAGGNSRRKAFGGFHHS